MRLIVPHSALLKVKTMPLMAPVAQAQATLVAMTLMMVAHDHPQQIPSAFVGPFGDRTVMKKLRTHYDNLKVSRQASMADIRQAYRRLASIHHPDKNGNSASSIRAMQFINTAYKVLKNPSSRAEHDRWIDAQEPAIEVVIEAPSPQSASPRKKPSKHYSQSEPPATFKSGEFPPKKWNPEHFVAFADYSVEMTKLLGSEGRAVVTLDALYRAFLHDRKTGHRMPGTAPEARDALQRSSPRVFLKRVVTTSAAVALGVFGFAMYEGVRAVYRLYILAQ
jgi:hypothetical protein